MKTTLFITFFILSALVLSACSDGSASLVDEKNAMSSMESEGEQEDSIDMVNIPVETSSDGDLADLGASQISWPGEVVSYSDAQITPTRDGKIAALLVKIGDYVKQGHIIARLSPPQSTMELTGLLADRKQALVNAQAQADATRKLVSEAKKKLEERQEALIRSRDAALQVVENEAIQGVKSTEGAAGELKALRVNREAKIRAAESELEQAEAIVSIQFEAARAAIKVLSQRFSAAVSLNGVSPEAPEKVQNFQFQDLYFQSLEVYGLGSPDSKQEFKKTLAALLSALKVSSSLPDKEALDYITASLHLLGNTSSSNPTMATELKNIRNILYEDQDAYLDTMKEYKEAKIDVEVKRSRLEKTKSESDREIIQAETNVQVSQSYLKTNESIKASRTADADQEFIRERTDLEVKVAELERQQALAEAEVKASAAAYSLIQSGIGGEIRAPIAGIISGISKKVGDYVTVDTVIAVTSSNTASDRFIRFRIPSDMKLPQKNEELMVERPGFPMAPKKAKVVGIGLALDENGSYQADAKFLEATDWPVNASVRVIPVHVNHQVLIPLSAVWWAEEGGSYLWFVDEHDMIEPRAVTLGRAFGDRVAVEGGLQSGERFIPAPTMDIAEGQMVVEPGEDEAAAKEAHEGMSM